MNEERAPTNGARSWGPQSPPSRWDAIVIGAGVGGLAAAGILAQLGKRVLVLEQHAVPGGYSQSFRRAHWSWDVGLHVVGELGRKGLAAGLFGALSGGQLEWATVQGAWDEAELPGGPTIEFRPGLRERLMQHFPRERDGIARWFRLQHQAATAMRRRFVARLGPWDSTLALTRTSEVLASVTRDPHLAAALGLHWFFYGTPPERSAFGVHALLTRHFRHGAWYPRGGAMSIARTFTAELARHDGWTRTRADVQELLLERGKVGGVRLATGEVLRAGLVISAAGALNTLTLLPAPERPRDLDALRPALGHVCLHVGFRGDIRSAGATTANRWLLADLSGRVWDTRTAVPPSAYLAFPSLKDAVDAHTAEVVAFVDWEPFARFASSRWRHRPAKYEALKAELSQRLLQVLLARLPKLKELVAYTELSTPLSNAHFARAANGSAYGLESSPERYAHRWLKPRTLVPGLYLAGSDVSVVGITGALASGVSAALAIEPERTGQWLHAAVRGTKTKTSMPTKGKGGHHAELAHRSALER
jgi:all-trans-retinol 13,14-reductase